MLEEYFDDSITEQINSSYTLTFSTYLDDLKSQYIQVGNLVEVEEQLFNIIHHRRTRSDNGQVVLVVECEQVSYDLLFRKFESFIHANTPSNLLSMALDGTAFTVGTVELTNVVSVDLKEATNARAVLMEIARVAEGELKFDKYNVSLQRRRGKEHGVQFRLGKNLKGIIKDVNGQSGEVTTAYEIDVVELNTLPEFKGIEEFGLGDTVTIIDEELGINERQRIIQYTYSPRMRINSKVVIANSIEGIQDTIYRIEQTTVAKDKYYYNTRIGPEIGFESMRWDKKARSVMNGDEIKIQKGNGAGSWTNAIYMDANGDARFTGIVEASQFKGGTIEIGFGNQVFKAGSQGIWLGNSEFENAPFSVSMQGKMKARGAEFSGDISASTINGGTINGTNINGANINGTTITGGTINGSTISTRVGNGKGIELLSGYSDINIYSGVSVIELAFAIQDLLGDTQLYFKRDGYIGANRQIFIDAPGGVIINGERVGG